MAKGNKIIAHICNDVGGWGKGFVLAISRKWKEPEKAYRKWYKDKLAISRKWKEPEKAYRKWYKDKNDFKLGEVQLIPVTDYISICNMIGQKGTKTGSKGAPIRYEAVESCLEKLSEIAKEQQAIIHMPRIGCGLAGGKWEIIEPIIRKTLIANDIEVYIYDFD
ncbi:macro domain-containing protein [Listeria monocytogenes]|uniref:macro domain-containing protein n=1 Tax=Listeria monocytogenes TaxID=1639 RepID=UPI001F2D43E4|nr:macro domain-containing protein [Listeria monocytogenes]